MSAHRSKPVDRNELGELPLVIQGGHKPPIKVSLLLAMVGAIIVGIGEAFAED